MIITAPALGSLFVGFKAAFNKGFEGAASTYTKVAMEVTSSTAQETYGWLGQFPDLREWIGPRVVHNLQAHGYIISNRKFEVTLSVPRESIEDDQYGVFTPMFENMGQVTRKHPDALVYEVLGSGFTGKCYDEKPFFAPDHTVTDKDGNVTATHSNVQEGDGPAWFLLDTSRPFRPLVFQKRIDYAFTSLFNETDANVFYQDEYVYGVRARANAGFGLWQLAFGSKAPLTHDNYEAARQAMMAVTGEHGRKLGVKPTVLVVPDALEIAAKRIVVNGQRLITVGSGADERPMSVPNDWAGTAEMVVSSFL